MEGTGRSEPFDLSHTVIGLLRDGTSTHVEVTGGPPKRVDGFTVGAPMMTQNAPHRGELHPDGDELLYVISGSVQVELEEADGERSVPVGAGQGLIVPRGVWHRVLLQEPTHLIHITPGPGGDHRPL
ncbi:MAG TPA: cupin domain-containing protein [Acidimicrobiales bacterium]|nr:cupin domain-containing protein [Acidimicrobiales bacterium]